MEKLKLVALMGKSKSGKNTSGELLCAIDPEAAQMAFADKLKAVVGELFELPHEALYDEAGKEKKTTFPCLSCFQCGKLEVADVSSGGSKLGSCKVCGTIGALDVFKSFWTGRTILQHVGTEGFRRVWPDVWASFAVATARKHLEAHSFVVLTDCRFKNEVDAVRNAGGEVWRIKRPAVDSQTTGIVGHASEMEQESIPDSQLDAVIMNDGTLEALNAKLVGELVRFKKKYADG